MKDIVWVAVAFLATRLGIQALGFPRLGFLAIAVAVCVCGWRLALSGQGWDRIGLGWPRWSWSLLGWTFLALIAAYLAVGLVVNPIANALNWKPGDYTAYGPLTGNPALLLMWLAVAWTTAAFGEEILFRGFLQQRLLSEMRPSMAMTAVAVLAQASLFAVAHATQGARGMLSAGAIGLVFGGIWLLNGRSLWPLILAHGFIDTLGLIALYAGISPGGAR